MITTPLGKIASSRSGDKGADSNVAVWTDSEERYRFLCGILTEERVADYFAAFCRGGVQRYELDNLRALNFILKDSLDGGGTASLRTDAQGKTLSLGLLQMMVDVDEKLVK